MDNIEISTLCDKLEAVENSLHSGAFNASRDTVRLMRALSKGKTSRSELVTPETAALPALMRQLSGTVSQPARGRFVQAASVLESLLQDT